MTMIKHKRGKGKRKGSKFERSVCNTLSRFIDREGTDTHFWRSAMSGGRSTIQAFKGIKNKNQAGDITCVSQKAMESFLSKFVIECKFYRDLNLEACFLERKGNLWKFWRQLKKVAKKNEMVPLLIAKQNRTKTLVLTNDRGLQTFRTYGERADPRLTLKSDTMFPVHILYFEEVFK